MPTIVVADGASAPTTWATSSGHRLRAVVVGVPPGRVPVGRAGRSPPTAGRAERRALSQVCAFSAPPCSSTYSGARRPTRGRSPRGPTGPRPRRAPPRAAPRARTADPPRERCPQHPELVVADRAGAHRWPRVVREPARPVVSCWFLTMARAPGWGDPDGGAGRAGWRGRRAWRGAHGVDRSYTAGSPSLRPRPRPRRSGGMRHAGHRCRSAAGGR